jgi:hypothetical protein
VCRSPNRTAIDRALLAGESYRTVADRERLSKTALIRHRGSHLPREMAKAQEVREVAAADDLIGQLKALQSKTVGTLLNAEREGDHRVKLLAIREARSNLELLWRFRREVDDERLAAIERQLEEVAARFRPMLRIAR